MAKAYAVGMAITAHLVDVLKSETFWVAAQSIFALTGVVILFKYTKYTKRMMELQLETRRAEVAPVFTLSSLWGSASDPATLIQLNAVICDFGCSEGVLCGVSKKQIPFGNDKQESKRWQRQEQTTVILGGCSWRGCRKLDG